MNVKECIVHTWVYYNVQSLSSICECHKYVYKVINSGKIGKSRSGWMVVWSNMCNLYSKVWLAI